MLRKRKCAFLVVEFFLYSGDRRGSVSHVVLCQTAIVYFLIGFPPDVDQGLVAQNRNWVRKILMWPRQRLSCHYHDYHSIIICILPLRRKQTNISCHHHKNKKLTISAPTLDYSFNTAELLLMQ